MDFAQIYSFLFESFAGIGVLVGIVLVIGIIACVIWEVRTRKAFKDRGPAEDEWAIFDDEDEN